MDRRGGVFDGRLESVAPDEKAVGCEAEDFVELNSLIHRIPRGLACRGVDDLEYFGERPPQRLLTRPACHAFGHWIEIGHVARDIGTEHRVANRVQRDGGALLLEEQRLFRGLSLDDPLEGSRQRVTVEAVPPQIVLRAARDGLHAGVFVIPRADDEDWDVRRRHRKLLEGRNPTAVRQAQIEQNRCDPVPAQPFEAVDEPRRAFDDE